MIVIESGFPIQNILDNKGLLGADKYLTRDLDKAVETIKAILTEEQLKAFSIKTLQIIENLEFKPLTFAQIREYVELELLLVVQEGTQTNFDIKKMNDLVQDCEKYAQKHEVPVNDPKLKVTVWATATSKDLELLKQKFKTFLALFLDPTNTHDIGRMEVFILGKIKRIDIAFYNNDKNCCWITFAFD